MLVQKVFSATAIERKSHKTENLCRPHTSLGVCGGVGKRERESAGIYREYTPRYCHASVCVCGKETQRERARAHGLVRA